jgi:3'-5' exoribonuclease
MQYLKDVKVDEQVIDHYLCASKQSLKTRTGKTYYSLKLQDKTAMVDAKIWDLNSGIENFEEGDYIKIDALAISFQGSIQLNIRRVRKSEEGEYNPQDYIPVSERDVDEMYSELVAYVESVSNVHLSKLLKSFFMEDDAFKKAFMEHTAAKTMHHNFYGGLLEHTLCVADLCDFYCKQYKELNRNLLISAALLHDIGKLAELSQFPIIEYTDEGQLMGHIVISIEWISKKIDKIDKFPVDLANLLKHCIVAHHGELEYGSPKKPEIIEAVALHFADNTDAKIKAFSTIMKSAEKELTWIGWQKMFETNIRRTRY